MTSSKGASVRLLEVLDLDAQQALVFDDDDTTIETIFSLNNIQRHRGAIITASFKYYAVVGKETDSLTFVASGNVQSAATVPARYSPELNLLHLDTNRFYALLDELRYHHTGPFRALSGLKRKLGAAVGLISQLKDPATYVHPTWLDATFQSILLTHHFRMTVVCGRYMFQRQSDESVLIPIGMLQYM